MDSVDQVKKEYEEKLAEARFNECLISSLGLSREASEKVSAFHKGYFGAIKLSVLGIYFPFEKFVDFTKNLDAYACPFTVFKKMSYGPSLVVRSDVTKSWVESERGVVEYGGLIQPVSIVSDRFNILIQTSLLIESRPVTFSVEYGLDDMRKILYRPQVIPSRGKYIQERPFYMNESLQLEGNELSSYEWGADRVSIGTKVLFWKPEAQNTDAILKPSEIIARVFAPMFEVKQEDSDDDAMMPS